MSLVLIYHLVKTYIEAGMYVLRFFMKKTPTMTTNTKDDRSQLKQSLEQLLNPKKRQDFYVVIGIDTGVSTGLAIWDNRTKMLITVKTMMIHQAMRLVQEQAAEVGPERILVRFEDARLRKYFGRSGREKLQGAGSVKRDAKIWEDFLKDEKIPFECVAPRNNTTKMEAGYFRALTGWKGITSEHTRDATMLVFQYH